MNVVNRESSPIQELAFQSGLRQVVGEQVPQNVANIRRSDRRLRGRDGRVLDLPKGNEDCDLAQSMNFVAQERL